MRRIVGELLTTGWIAGTFPILIASLPFSCLNSFHHLVLSFAKRGKIFPSSSSKRFTVPQRFFFHFYVLAVVWTTLLVATTSTYAYNIISSHKSPSIPIAYIYGVWRSVFLLFLMQVQVVMRLIETIYVFKYSSTARMHIFGYLTGLFFYTAAPLSVCCNYILEVYKYSIYGVAEFIVKGKKNIMQDMDLDWLQFSSSLVKLGWSQWIGAAVFFWGWIHQRRCHEILGSLRQDGEKSDKYVIPHGDWFEYVSSPHYLAEIVSNLVFVAAETHRWYHQNFKSNKTAETSYSFVMVDIVDEEGTDWVQVCETVEDSQVPTDVQFSGYHPTNL